MGGSPWPAFIGSFASILATVLLGLPIYRRHQSANKKRHDRQEATADAVLGKAADPNRGRSSFQPGLVHVVPLGNNAINGIPTVMGALEDARQIAKEATAEATKAVGSAEIAASKAADAAAEAAKAAANSVQSSDRLAVALDVHLAQDQERFNAIDAQLENIAAHIDYPNRK